MKQGGEQGSAAIEAVIAGPLVVLMVLLVVFGGRVALAHQSVQAIAANTARAASLARSPAQATSAANQAMQAGFQQSLPCKQHTLSLDLAGFDKPPGTPASVTATISCRLTSADLGLPGLPDLQVSSAMTSAVDTYRERR